MSVRASSLPEFISRGYRLTKMDRHTNFENIKLCFCLMIPEECAQRSTAIHSNRVGSFCLRLRQIVQEDRSAL